MAKDALLMFHTGTTSLGGEMSQLQVRLNTKLKRGRVNDKYVSMPFLTQSEVDSMYDDGIEIVIFGDDKDLQVRIKRHFK